LPATHDGMYLDRQLVDSRKASWHILRLTALRAAWRLWERPPRPWSNKGLYVDYALGKRDMLTALPSLLSFLHGFLKGR
jgi:hypothetical protein